MLQADAMLCQEDQQRQQGQAEHGEVIAFDAAKKMRAQPLELVGADRGAYGLSGAGQVGIEEGIGERSW